MSFGKNDSHLAKIGGYGATSSQQMGNASRRQTAPRRGSPSWANNYSPSEGTPDIIRIIPGDFEGERINSETGAVYIEQVPWFEFTEHFFGTKKKGTICSGGVYRMADWKKASPCRGCDIWREDAQERKRIENETGIKPQNPKRVSFSNKYAFIVLDTGYFFKGYRLDENGRPRVSDRGSPYIDWVKYNDQNANLYQMVAQDMQRQGKNVEVQQGMIRPWPVNSTQFGVLNGYADMIQRHCKNCGGQNCIHTSHWVCPHCSAPTLQQHETTMPMDKVKELVSGIIACRNCRQAAYPKPVSSCQHCSNPTPASLFDVDLQIQTIKVKDEKTLHLAGVIGPKPIDGTFSELLKKLPDVVKKFSPTSYEEQIALFGAANSQEQALQPPQFQQPGQHFGQPQYQAPALGSYGQPQYSVAQTPPQQAPTQTWNGNGWNNGQQ